MNKNSWTLESKKALKGIGLATAWELMSLGAEVMIVSRHQPDIDRMLAEAKKFGHKISGVAADVSTQEGRSRIYKSIMQLGGRLDIL
jgi:NAD(P)-dependent dehydrogenase (short-subunit alcohol dehydrogenase family)